MSTDKLFPEYQDQPSVEDQIMALGNKPTKISDIACPPSKAVLDATDTINRGDRVSWSFDDGHPRQFGRVVRLCVKDYNRAFSVRDDDGNGHIVPARYITKECG